MTDSTNFWTALGLELLLAVKETSYIPVVLVVPLNTPLVGLKLIPLGKVPDSLKVGVGLPLSVTVKVPATPAVKVVLEPLLIVGATVVGATLTGAELELTDHFWLAPPLHVHVCIWLPFTVLAYWSSRQRPE
jgi:hypothetical protein